MMARVGRVPSRRSLRGRAILIALFVAVPLIAPVFVRAFERREAEERLVAARARELAVAAARAIDARANDARTLLAGLRETLEPSADPSHNDGHLQRLWAAVPQPYSNLWIVDTLGRNIGTARLPRDRTSIGIDGWPILETVRRTPVFTVGLPVRSRVLVDSALVIPFALPMLDPVTGALRAIVGATVPVDSLDAVQMMRRLPEGSVLTVVDREERVLFRTRDNAQWMGRTLRQIVGESEPVAATGGATVRSKRSRDGFDRVIGYEPVPRLGWMVYLGLPTQAALAATNSQFQRDLVWSAVGALLLLALAVALSLAVVRPIESLTADARALTLGDESRRSTIDTDDEIGDLARAFNMMADVAEQRRAALRESELRYRMLFDANPLPLFAWRPPTGQITGVNDAAVSHFGLSREALLERTVSSLLHVDDVGRFVPIAAAAPTGPQHSGVWRMQHADGRLFEMELLLAPYQHASGDQVVTVAIDITARRAAERALEESREQLRQSQKLEALGSFAGGIAHDFNNYLSAIIGYAELLDAQLHHDPAARRDVHEVLTAAARAADLTRQILIFSRKQVVEPSILDPVDVVRGIERMLARVMREDIAITTALAPDTGHVRVDRGQLEQILVNLAANARDAMPDGGTFQIATRPVEVRLGDPRHAGVAPGRYVQLTASDTGVGMSEAVRQRIFEPFFTTKERGRGTGLGLSLVYSIVQQADGAIRVESTPGVGTTIEIYLPAIDAPAASTGRATVGPMRTGDERILLVEDDDAVRGVTTQMLVRHGYQVAEARNGHDALTLYARHPAAFTLVITDVVMPGMRGGAFAEAVRKISPQQPILFVSGYADDALLIEALPGAAFLPKPFTTAELLQKVRQLLDAPTLAPPR